MKYVSTIISLLLIFGGCSRESPPKEEPKESLRTYTVSSEQVKSILEATGTVQPDLEGGAKIVSPVQGSVERILVKIGDRVKKGTALITLRSPDVSDAAASYRSALAQLSQADRLNNLNKQLFEIGAVTRNDVLNSEANYEQARALSEGLKKKLDIYGVSGDGIHDSLTIRAPIDGTVADLPAHIGDRFDTNVPLMTIADPDKTVVVANVYGADVLKLRKGEEVTFYADVLPASVFKGTISYISDVEDMDSKTVKTYIKNLNGTRFFRQNMFLNIRILVGEKQMPVVPKTTLIFKDGKFFVNKKQGKRFELVEVKPAGSASNKMMTVEGLKEGDEIAYSAIDLEKP